MTEPLASRPTALYRFFGADGELLYVGITHDLQKRWGAHRLLQTWWHLVTHKTFEWYENRALASEAEMAAIESERPRFDKTNTQSLSEQERSCYQDPREDEIEAQLSADIQAEEYRNGRMLLFATVLADRYGTSAMTIHILMWRLEDKRVVEGRGAHYWLRGCRPKR